MSRDMADAYIPSSHKPVGRLQGTGIRLAVTDEDGKAVNYGVQLNNTILEIEALPNLKVAVKGYTEMYEALKIITPWAKKWIKYLRKNIGSGQGQGADEVFDSIETALAKAEGK